jgi:hypothetical protein
MLFKSASTISDMDFAPRGRSRSNLSNSPTSPSSSAPLNVYSCNIYIKDETEGKYKFRVATHASLETSVTEQENSIIHYKFDTMFRNTPVLITKWKKSKRSDKSDLNSCFMCVPMRLKQSEAIRYYLHGLPKSDFYTDVVEPETIEVRVEWTRRTAKELVAHWTFNRISNINLHASVQDVTGKGNHVQLKNLNTDNPVLCHGVRQDSYAMYFSGFNYLYGEKNPLKGLSEFSISFWFKFAKGQHTDDTVLLSCIRTVESDSIDPLLNYDPTTLKNLSDSELFVNELYHGPKYRAILNRDSQYLNASTSYDERSARRSRSSSFTGVFSDAFTSRSSFSLHKRARSLNSTTEIGFTIGTKKNTFMDQLGNNLVLTRKKNQKRKQYDTVYGRVLNKSLNDAEDLLPTELKQILDPELEEEDEDVNIEDDETTEEFERSDFFKCDDWNHVVISYSGDRLREYINGTLTDDRRGTFGVMGDASKFVIGAMTDGYAFSGFRGALDELKVFNYAVTSKEVVALYSWKDQLIVDEYSA